MSAARVARRYAAALFELYQQGLVDRDELSNAACAAADSVAAPFLASPDFDKGVKAMVVKTAIKMEKETVITRLIDLLSERGKLVLLPEIEQQLAAMIARAESQAEVNVTVATALDEREEAALLDALKRTSGGDVRLHVTQDGSILGGLIVQIGDRKIDASVRSKLDALKQAISN